MWGLLCSLQVRRRSKACRAGLKEQDELVAIDDHVCAELSHAQAMSLIDSQSSTLSLRVKRSEHGPTQTNCTARTMLYGAMSDKLMHVCVCFQGPLWIPLLILLWSLRITPLLHEGPVSPCAPLVLPPSLSPLTHRDPQGHNFPSRQRGLLRRNRQRRRHAGPHSPPPAPHASSCTLTCALWQPRRGGDLRDERVRSPRPLFYFYIHSTFWSFCPRSTGKYKKIQKIKR